MIAQQPLYYRVVDTEADCEVAGFVMRQDAIDWAFAENQKLGRQLYEAGWIVQ